MWDGDEHLRPKGRIELSLEAPDANTFFLNQQSRRSCRVAEVYPDCARGPGSGKPCPILIFSKCSHCWRKVRRFEAMRSNEERRFEAQGVAISGRAAVAAS